MAAARPPPPPWPARPPALDALASWAATLVPAPPAAFTLPPADCGPSLWAALAADSGLRASGARLLRLTPGDAASRPLWRAVRAHPRVRWVGVFEDSVDERLARVLAGRPLNVAVVAPATEVMER